VMHFFGFLETHLERRKWKRFFEDIKKCPALKKEIIKEINRDLGTL
jgi:hypothetical protein